MQKKLNWAARRRARKRKSVTQKEKWSLDNTVKIVQLASILTAAGWGFYEYISFRKQNNESILAQQELSLATAKIALLASGIAREQAAIDLAKSKNQRISTEVTFKIGFQQKIDDNLNRYEVLFGLRVTNISDEELEISYEMTEYFLGEIAKEASTKPIVAINKPTYTPSKNITFSNHPGAIQWTEIGSQSYVYPAARNEMERLLPDVNFGNNGTVTSVLGPAESSFGTVNYLVVGEPGQFVSFGITFGIDRAISGSEVWSFHGTGDLEPISRQVE